MGGCGSEVIVNGIVHKFLDRIINFHQFHWRIVRRSQWLWRKRKKKIACKRPNYFLTNRTILFCIDVVGWANMFVCLVTLAIETKASKNVYGHLKWCQRRASNISSQRWKFITEFLYIPALCREQFVFFFLVIGCRFNAQPHTCEHRWPFYRVIVYAFRFRMIINRSTDFNVRKKTKYVASGSSSIRKKNVTHLLTFFPITNNNKQYTIQSDRKSRLDGKIIFNWEWDAMTMVHSTHDTWHRLTMATHTRIRHIRSLVSRWIVPPTHGGPKYVSAYSHSHTYYTYI